MDLLVLRTWMQARLSGAERGASLVEYAFLVGFIAVVAVVAVKALGSTVSTHFSQVDSGIQ